MIYGQKLAFLNLISKFVAIKPGNNLEISNRHEGEYFIVR